MDQYDQFPKARQKIRIKLRLRCVLYLKALVFKSPFQNSILKKLLWTVWDGKFLKRKHHCTHFQILIFTHFYTLDFVL